MAKRVLTRIGLPSETCSSLASIGVTTCGELLLTSPLTIMSACDVSYQEALQLIYLVSEKIAPAPMTALQSLQQRRKQSVYLATGLVPLDRALRGGLLLGTITDLCGAPGVGKTQFCLSCVIQYLAEGFKRGESKNRSVIYIDAELKLDASRLIEIAAERFTDIFSPDHNISAPHNLDDLLTHIQILRPNSAVEFEAVVAELQTTIVRAKASLVIVDSIASIVRKENWDEREKEAFLIAQSQTLKMTSEVCGCAILATNQVTPAGFSVQGGDLSFEKIIHDGSEYIPTLGRTWYHCVTTRLTMTTSTPSDNRQRPRHVITVQKSPIVPRASLIYTIASKGIVEDVRLEDEMEVA